MVESWVFPIWHLDKIIKQNKGFDAIRAFEKRGHVDFVVGKNSKIKVEDEVYIYVGEPESKIFAKTIVILDNLKREELSNDAEFVRGEPKQYDENKKYVRLQLVEFFPNEIKEKLSLELLQQNGLVDKKGNGITIQSKQRLGKIYDYVKMVGKEISLKLETEIKKIEVLEKKLVNLNKTERYRIVKSRIGQGIFKDILLEFDCRCKICELDNEKFLIASHIKPWKDSNDDERLNFFNGFLLCPNHDSLFDKGYISFTENGSIIISESLNKKTSSLMNVNPKIKITIQKGHEKYLEWHRENVFVKNEALK